MAVPVIAAFYLTAKFGWVTYRLVQNKGDFKKTGKVLWNDTKQTWAYAYHFVTEKAGSNDKE